jgi:exonuclease III
MLEDTLNNNYTHDTLVLGGDFNFTQGSIDRQDANVNNRNKQWLANILHTFLLVDAYRIVNPTGQDTTYVHASYTAKSRLDMFYVPENKKIAMVYHLKETLGYTDHKAVYVRLTESETDHARQRGSPHWKLNNSLLKSEFYTKI